MKTLILIFVLLLSVVTTKSQTFPFDSSTHKVDYQEVVHVDSLSKDELFTRSREWFALICRDSKSVIQMDDRQSGKMIGKGNSKGYYKMLLVEIPFRVNFTLSITCKDNRYRYEMTDFVITNDENPTDKYSVEEILSKKKDKDVGYFGIWKAYLKGIEETYKNITTQLKDAMKEKRKDDF